MKGVNVANIEAGERTLEIGDDRWTLKFRAGDYLELEDVLGYSSGKLEQKFAERDVGFTELQALIWAATRKHHTKEIRTLREVTQIMNNIPKAEGGPGYQEVWQVVTEAYGIGQGAELDEDEEDSDNGTPKATAKAGSKKSSPGSDS
jgi:hypothetical protein